MHLHVWIHGYILLCFCSSICPSCLISAFHWGLIKKGKTESSAVQRYQPFSKSFTGAGFPCRSDREPGGVDAITKTWMLMDGDGCWMLIVYHCLSLFIIVYHCLSLLIVVDCWWLMGILKVATAEWRLRKKIKKAAAFAADRRWRSRNRRGCHLLKNQLKAPLPTKMERIQNL